MSAHGWEVLQTVHRLLEHLDNGRFEDVAALFADDGVWHRQGRRLTGPAGVLAALRDRPAALATRHIASNAIVGEAAADGTTVRYCITSFAHEGPFDGAAPVAHLHAIFACEDRLVETPRGWRFAERRPTLVFKGA